MSELEHIIHLLEQMEQNQQRFLKVLETKFPSVQVDPALWADGLKVQDLLEISRATLYRFRTEEDVSYFKVGSRTYYYLPDIYKKKNHFLK